MCRIVISSEAQEARKDTAREFNLSDAACDDDTAAALGVGGNRDTI